MSDQPQCLRCALTLTVAEVEKGGRWKEFCHPCREILQCQFSNRDEPRAVTCAGCPWSNA